MICSKTECSLNNAGAKRCFYQVFFIKYFWRKLELEAKSILESEMLVARFYSVSFMTPAKSPPHQAVVESSPMDNRRCQKLSPHGMGGKPIKQSCQRARRGLVLHRGVMVPSNVVRFKCRVQAGLIFIPTLVIPVWFEQELEGAGWGLGMVLFGAVPTPSQLG